MYSSLFIIPFLVSSLVASFFGMVVRRMYSYFGWLDDPAHQTHSKVVHLYPVPRGGGLVVSALAYCSEDPILNHAGC